jgi:hypothetical protein
MDLDRDLRFGWKTKVLHEFGHAVGFELEHQHPIVPCDFRFGDEPGYVPTQSPEGEFIPDRENRSPGLHRRLGGPPNNLSGDEVDANLAKLKLDSHMYLASDFDPLSVMKYDLPFWMYRRGKESHCYTGRINDEL